MDSSVVRALIGLAAGTAAGGALLAALDSPWALLCALGFVVAVMGLAVYAGVARQP